MSRRIWVIRVGDHFFLRKISDLYESLTTRYTEGKQPRGILSLFPNDVESPLVNKKKYVSTEAGITAYIKDEESSLSFEEDIPEETDLKIYIAGHGHKESCSQNGLSSLEAHIENDYRLDFRLSPATLAEQLDSLLKKVKIRSTAVRPITISLIACYATREFDKENTFAYKLLTELTKKNYSHILIKARAGLTPAPLFGKKPTSATKEHFYSDGTEFYHVNKNNDFRWHALKMIKKCEPLTTEEKSAVSTLLSMIEAMGYKINVEEMHALQNRLKTYNATIRKCLQRKAGISGLLVTSQLEKEWDALLRQSSFYPYKTSTDFVKRNYDELSNLRDQAAAPYIATFLNKLIDQIESNQEIDNADKATFASLKSDHFEPYRININTTYAICVTMLRYFLNLFTLLFTLGQVNQRNFLAEAVIKKPYFFPPPNSNPGYISSALQRTQDIIKDYNP